MDPLTLKDQDDNIANNVNIVSARVEVYSDLAKTKVLPYFAHYDPNRTQSFDATFVMYQLLNTSIEGSGYELLDGEQEEDLDDLYINVTVTKVDNQGNFVEELKTEDGNTVSGFASLAYFQNNPSYTILGHQNPFLDDAPEELTSLMLDFLMAAQNGNLNLYNIDGTRLQRLGLQARFTSEDPEIEKRFNEKYKIVMDGNDEEGWALKVGLKSAPAPAPAPAAKAEPVVAPKPVFKRKALDLRYARDDFYNKNGVYKPVSLLYGPYKPIAE
ncbi:MAG: hypothetical protein Q4E22_06445 [Coriobacteriia bacterium]|nr:hypothetical protein [Coriobacteriia bacterium]